MSKRDTILIVDDQELNRVILRNIFEKSYNILEAENGEQALLLAQQYHETIMAMLLDLIMPIKDGHEVMKELTRHKLMLEFPVIVITAEGTAENEIMAFDLGASDLIIKPFEPHVVQRRVQNVIELNMRKLNQQELIDDQAMKIRESNAIMVDALSSIIEYRSVETGQHIQRIRMFTEILLRDVMLTYPEFGLSERSISIIADASALHDIGKIAIPDMILNKPAKLTPEEFHIMKTHTTKGCEMLARLDGMSEKEYLTYAYNICRYHHERWDGLGYPDGLKGECIPICAQVVGVADCYDALTNDRIYKSANLPEEAFNMICNGECGTFSPKLLECFKNVRDTFFLLSSDYADGKSNERFVVGEQRMLQPPSDDTLPMGQLKYFTLLQYADATVMEVDFKTGFYHVVYLSSPDFELLKSGNIFRESILNFIQGMVLLEEQEMAKRYLDKYIEEFFDNGLTKRSVKLNIYHRATSTFEPCRITLLRVNTDNPHNRKAMFIFERQKDNLDSTISVKPENHIDNDFVLDNLLGGVQVCRIDRWFTMTQVNSGLVTMLGYSKKEISEQFKNHYIEFIHPLDRERVLINVKEQMNRGNIVDNEYRLVAKDGRIIWVVDKGQLVTGDDGFEYVLCVLIDITQSKKAQEELRLTMERHRIIMEQANDIIFEWDMVTDTLTYSNNWKKKFGYDPIRENASERILKISHIHPGDLMLFSKLIEEMRGNMPYTEMEFRLADFKGRYRWCKIRAAAQLDDTDKPFKVVGVLMDIDDEKKASQILKDEAQRDGLTRLYNKNFSRQLIENTLDSGMAGKLAAMFIVDMDNFKLINDNYGHMFGDGILQGFSNELNRLFRTQDVISRIGGDEFLIFMHNVPDVNIVKTRAEKIIAASHRLFRENNIPYIPSCSIGIAFYPADGMTFEALFRHSDFALYDAKSKGKNCYSLFDKKTMKRPVGVPKRQLSQNTAIETNDAPEFIMNDLSDQVFRMLYESNDLDQVMNSILELVGMQFDVSRVYIFEDNDDGSECSNTFEWCNEGITSQKSYFQHFSYENLDGHDKYKGFFTDEGIFYCPNVELLPKSYRQIISENGTKSLLQCEMKDENGFKGFIGFDDCRIVRFWTKEQIENLSFIARLLSVFLLKKRARDQALDIASGLRKILDHQDAWVYIVEPETFLLRYINAKAKTLAPDACLGMRCYEAFFSNSSPCRNCPVYHGLKNEPVEIYNSLKNVWALVSASIIEWDNRKSCLVTCQDITAYKENEAKNNE